MRITSCEPSIPRQRHSQWALWALCSFGEIKERKSEVAQLCPTLCNPMDCSLSGSSIHGIFQARVLESGAMGRLNSYESAPSCRIVCVCVCVCRICQCGWLTSPRPRHRSSGKCWHNGNSSFLTSRIQSVSKSCQLHLRNPPQCD